MNPFHRITGSTRPVIHVTPSTRPTLDPAEVAAALGAVPTGVTIPAGGSPMAKFAARREAFRHLTGGTVTVGSEQWAKLDALAAAVSGSPERVAGVLLAWALERVEKGELPDALRSAPADADSGERGA